jgi:hypothetical protein
MRIDQSEKIANRIWILGKNRRKILLNNRNKTQPIYWISKEGHTFRLNGINTSGTLLNVITDAEAKLKHGVVVGPGGTPSIDTWRLAA